MSQSGTRHISAGLSTLDTKLVCADLCTNAKETNIAKDKNQEKEENGIEVKGGKKNEK